MYTETDKAWCSGGSCNSGWVVVSVCNIIPGLVSWLQFSRARNKRARGETAGLIWRKASWLVVYFYHAQGYSHSLISKPGNASPNLIMYSSSRTLRQEDKSARTRLPATLQCSICYWNNLVSFQPLFTPWINMNMTPSVNKNIYWFPICSKRLSPIWPIPSSPGSTRSLEPLWSEITTLHKTNQEWTQKNIKPRGVEIWGD